MPIKNKKATIDWDLIKIMHSILLPIRFMSKKSKRTRKMKYTKVTK